MVGWTSLLVILLCKAVTLSLSCDWLRHYGHLSNASLTLVQHMGGQLTDEESPLPFPYKLYRRMKSEKVASRLAFARDSLELIAGLYRHDNRSSAAWDPAETERFLMTIDRQAHGLQSCVSTQSRNDSRLRKYYRRLVKSTLCLTGGSPASWELIRRESKLHLDHLDQLMGSVMESVAASRRRRSAASRRRSSKASRRRSAASRRRSAASRRRSAVTAKQLLFCH
ncbi:interferon phi 1 [Clinocottus analis]|uniref:interferon phi 1 n=1 Tax=Clinocottus analis TaxID=304258 RepID=UPI0035BEFD7D